ncbi:hypothetical protein [Lelliottia wanjuensis]|uniref:Uncharacterized protein n=1 Tax=Lelliottia wanjuensis TaxID=3050585 RepID=A0AAP4D635_9ENTR|nr:MULTISPECIES: hypothetical protein [unclassified Lelliottia]MDK9364195.1 hypothetical protein [Lelliottia sp. V106_12]MDK9617128.1 hypothetical protein [Lelliottia sp. V106_9]
MTTFTNEQLTSEIETLEHFATNLKWTNVTGAQSLLFAADVMRQALAGMEADPVAYVDPHAFQNFSVYRAGETDNKRMGREWMWANPDAGLIPVYTAPQPLTDAERQELQEYRNAQQHPAATLYNGSGRVSVMMVSDLPAGEVDVYTTPQPVPVAHDNFMMPPRIENIELRSPLEVEDMWRARVRHMFRAAGLKLHEDESK